MPAPNPFLPSTTVAWHQIAWGNLSCSMFTKERPVSTHSMHVPFCSPAVFADRSVDLVGGSRHCTNIKTSIVKFSNWKSYPISWVNIALSLKPPGDQRHALRLCFFCCSSGSGYFFRIDPNKLILLKYLKLPLLPYLESHS